MKWILFVVLVLGFGALGGAQTQAPTPIQVSGRITAREGDVMRMSNVVFVLGAGVRLTADEAVANMAGRDFELRGNVHLTAPADR